MRLPIPCLFVLVACSVAPAADSGPALPLLIRFQPLPIAPSGADNEPSDAKARLGRMLFFDKRFSGKHDVACASCHDPKTFGTYNTNNPEFIGPPDPRSHRSFPSVYNAVVQLAQYRDGRALTLEDQAKNALLSPQEMATPEKSVVIRTINSMPGYMEAFKSTFPSDSQPVSYENVGIVLGAFQRQLLTPGRWDAYLKGQKDALTDTEKKGLQEFVSIGCVHCHNGPGVGGHLYQKLGLAKAWPDLNDKDSGRFAVTRKEHDRSVFKVASLRNVSETAPYLHDGSVADLPQMVRLMAEHQLDKALTDEQCQSIVAFLAALKGDLPTKYIQEPPLPASTSSTPKP